MFKCPYSTSPARLAREDRRAWMKDWGYRVRGETTSYAVEVGRGGALRGCWTTKQWSEGADERDGKDRGLRAGILGSGVQPRFGRLTDLCRADGRCANDSTGHSHAMGAVTLTSTPTPTLAGPPPA